jgi:hypothetical protein
MPISSSVRANRETPLIPGQRVEIEELRTERSKTYRVGPRQRQVEFHCKPVHYQVAQRWVPIDCGFELAENDCLALRNKVTVGLRRDGLRAKFLGLRHDAEHHLEWTLLGVEIDGQERLTGDRMAEGARSGAERHEIDVRPCEGLRVINRLNEVSLKQIFQTNLAFGQFKATYQVHLRGYVCVSRRDAGGRYQPNEKGQFAFALAEKPEAVALWINPPWIDDANGERHTDVIDHRLFEDGQGRLIYAKATLPAAVERVAALARPLLIDVSTYYAESSDGRCIYELSSSSIPAAWNECHDAGTSNWLYTANTYSVDSVQARKLNSGTLWRCGRSFFSFDTSGLPDACIITDADLMIRGYGNAGSSVVVQKSLQGSVLDKEDYDSMTGDPCADVITTWTTSDWNTFALNATGIAAISKTAWSSFALRDYGHDYLDVIPTGDTKYSGCYFSENADLTYDPYLSVTYIEESTQSGSVAADAEIAKVGASSITADAEIGTIRSASFSADAVLTGVKSESLTADAAIAKVGASSITAGAALASPANGSITADATIVAVGQGSITADAVVRSGLQTKTLSVDATITGPSSASFTVDALIQSSGAALGDTQARWRRQRHKMRRS